MRLRRRTEGNSVPEVTQAIEMELKGSASSMVGEMVQNSTSIY